MIHRRIFQGCLALAAAASVLTAAARLFPFSGAVKNGIDLGALIALANALACFAAVHWAFGKSDKIFFGAFFGGMLWKLAVLAGAFLWLPRLGTANAQGGLISLAIFTFLYNIVELSFLPRAEELHGL